MTREGVSKGADILARLDEAAKALRRIEHAREIKVIFTYNGTRGTSFLLSDEIVRKVLVAEREALRAEAHALGITLGDECGES